MKQRQRQALQIAIDGPAGAGKSTVAKIVAMQLRLFYVDTGAMYRAIAYKVLKSGASIDDESRVSQIAKTTEVVLDHSEERIVWCDGENITQAIRNPEISRAVSVVAAYQGVRDRLVELQRLEARRGGVVMDGRDIGTHVLPDADYKIFLTATPEERARRRWIELTEAGKVVAYDEVAQDMLKRDRSDSEREVSPLRPAQDAIILDTTGLSVEELVAEILKLTQEVES
ncbi:(d)CMP kinase [Desulfosporosinus sp. BICA1-9]|uniref:(d)CMP kinase n=1 Tax=Desulfosporosinus sp. BICA1-9 TaxID=1531958 RepID=UPI00054B84B0|nr:(d)CMP kinase [Desulfosporosinus sp. BICA1-9]KJS48262.1 MAG: cytidylate kinase [Peptococcaceae bacterium BRH_c23]KJS89356.1 MAG: cytidylate kinase [Desulfosporosinus sp. BICA1-9]HBW37293.1 (d)CMP kinase [Desulfosporosinus sp.]